MDVGAGVEVDVGMDVGGSDAGGIGVGNSVSVSVAMTEFTTDRPGCGVAIGVGVTKKGGMTIAAAAANETHSRSTRGRAQTGISPRLTISPVCVCGGAAADLICAEKACVFSRPIQRRWRGAARKPVAMVCPGATST